MCLVWAVEEFFWKKWTGIGILDPMSFSEFKEAHGMPMRMSFPTFKKAVGETIGKNVAAQNTAAKVAGALSLCTALTFSCCREASSSWSCVFCSTETTEGTEALSTVLKRLQPAAAAAVHRLGDQALAAKGTTEEPAATRAAFLAMTLYNDVFATRKYKTRKGLQTALRRRDVGALRILGLLPLC